MEGGVMNSCEECGRDLGPKAKVYPVVMQPDIFAICVKCINKFEFVFRPSFNCQLKTKAAVYHNFITKKINRYKNRLSALKNNYIYKLRH